MTKDSLQPRFEGPFHGGVRVFCILMIVIGAIGLVWNQSSDGDGPRSPVQPVLPDWAAVESVIARRAAEDSEQREEVLRQRLRIDQIERVDADFMEIVNANLHVMAGIDVRLEALEAWREEGGSCHHVAVVETLAAVMAAVERVQVYVEVLESVDAAQVEPSVEPGS